MSIFDGRKRGFEEKFRREEEFSFRLTARRNHPVWEVGCSRSRALGKRSGGVY
jgi:hypothetical protein